MAFAYATFPLLGGRDRNEYVCVGAPPEKEVAPEPRENGAMVAAIVRVLRGALRAGQAPSSRDMKPGRGRT